MQFHLFLWNNIPKKGRTEKIQFSELSVKRNKEGEIEEPEEIMVAEVDYNEIKQKDYSLNYKKYICEEMDCSMILSSNHCKNLLNSNPKVSEKLVMQRMKNDSIFILAVNIKIHK